VTYDFTFVVGPDATEKQVEALADAILDLPEFKDAGGSAVGVRKLSAEEIAGMSA